MALVILIGGFTYTYRTHPQNAPSLSKIDVSLIIFASEVFLLIGIESSILPLLSSEGYIQSPLSNGVTFWAITVHGVLVFAALVALFVVFLRRKKTIRIS